MPYLARLVCASYAPLISGSHWIACWDTQVYQWALELSMALSFMHGCQPPVIHLRGIREAYAACVRRG